MKQLVFYTKNARLRDIIIYAENWLVERINSYRNVSKDEVSALYEGLTLVNVPDLSPVAEAVYRASIKASIGREVIALVPISNDEADDFLEDVKRYQEKYFLN
jgi:hypothetical protein